MNAFEQGIADAKARACKRCLGNGSLTSCRGTAGDPRPWEFKTCEVCAGSDLAPPSDMDALVDAAISNHANDLIIMACRHAWSFFLNPANVDLHVKAIALRETALALRTRRRSPA